MRDYEIAATTRAFPITGIAGCLFRGYTRSVNKKNTTRRVAFLRYDVVRIELGGRTTQSDEGTW